MTKITSITAGELRKMDGRRARIESSDGKIYEGHVEVIDGALFIRTNGVRFFLCGGDYNYWFKLPIKWIEFIDEETPEWTPAYGEMIEVSDDGIKWDKKRFEHINERGLFRTEFEGLGGQNTSFKYARPITEIELPDFHYECSGEHTSGTTTYELGKQVEILTKYLKAKHK